MQEAFAKVTGEALSKVKGPSLGSVILATFATGIKPALPFTWNSPIWSSLKAAGAMIINLASVILHQLIIIRN